ncbi:hypothetical protein SS50377_24547 [Spironucleus salmonicida]|uniref:Uncharacterized protein n=1 Tax=Spironucleus salmonicida TaxID=348837 RepID=V6LQC5_9EUKA|nr:hypothetical protein SS50377_24547 [Spironucleus salmonicida]|eukprot:EST45911.1 Hypothetical protein SS50377_13887 [Spironucleus salmonicida]
MKRMSMRELQMEVEEDKTNFHILQSYYVHQVGEQFVGFQQNYKVFFDESYNYIRKEKIDFPCQSTDFVSVLQFPIISLNENQYVISPASIINPSKVYRLQNSILTELIQLTFTVTQGFAYCSYPQNSLLIRDDDLLYYEFDLTSLEIKPANKRFNQIDMDIFRPNDDLFLLQKRSLSILQIQLSGKVKKIELKNGQDDGFQAVRKVGQIPISWIQTFKTIYHCQKRNLLLCKVYLHGEDVINYIEQKRLVQQKIQLNPELYVSKKIIEEQYVKQIVHTTDVDIFKQDFTPALMPSKDSQVLIERTDPRMCVYISNLKFYQDLRSLYEKGLLLIDLISSEMFLFDNSIEVFTLDTRLEERIQILYRDEKLVQFIRAYFPHFQFPDEMLDKQIETTFQRHNSLNELPQ